MWRPWATSTPAEPAQGKQSGQVPVAVVQPNPRQEAPPVQPVEAVQGYPQLRRVRVGGQQIDSSDSEPESGHVDPVDNNIEQESAQSAQCVISQNEVIPAEEEQNTQDIGPENNTVEPNTEPESIILIDSDEDDIQSLSDTSGKFATMAITFCAFTCISKNHSLYLLTILSQY